MLEEIHFAGSVRTPFGNFCGAFADVSAVELGKAPVEAVRREAAGRQRTPRREHPQRRPPRKRRAPDPVIEAGLRRRRNG